MTELNMETQGSVDLEQLEKAAMAQLDSGDFAGALRGFRDLLERDANNALALQFLGFEASQRQDHVIAIDFYQRAATAHPGAETCFNFALALFGQARLSESLAALDSAVSHDSGLLAALLYRGTVFEQMGKPDDAARAFLRAVRTADAVLDQNSIPVDLRQYLNYAMGVVRVYLGAQINQSLADLVAEHGETSVARLRKAGEIFAGLRPREYGHPLWRPGLFLVPDLPARTFFEREEFAWSAAVEAATDMVRAELIALMEDGQGFTPYVDHAEGTHGALVFKDINRSTNWTSFHFYRHGERIEENCARCPGTAALLDSLDLQRVPGYGPEVMFSVLQPHSKIPAHYGAVNGRLVVHLPLIVPADCGALRVANEARGWEEGKLLFFDDTFEHEAWNNSDQTRVVLIFDTWNPALSSVERAAFIRVLTTAQRFERDAIG